MAYVNKINVQGTDYDIKDSAPLLENIVDSDGHKRFLEGNITIASQEGLTQDYGKWSLSGTHLLIVVAGTVEANKEAQISLNTPVVLPSWIKNKIYTLGSGDNVAYSEIKIYNNSTSAVTSKDVTLVKASDDFRFYHSGTIGDVDASLSFRVQFDLLIDNE